MYATGIGYRADMINDMTGSWDDLARADAEGQIYVLDDFQEAIGMANYERLRAERRTATDELEKSKQTLIDQKPLLRGYLHGRRSRTC